MMDLMGRAAAAAINCCRRPTGPPEEPDEGSGLLQGGQNIISNAQ
jgi:hypothetical protein